MLSTREAVVEPLFGRYVKEQLMMGQPLSRETLRDWLEQRITETESFRGRIDSRYDLARMHAEAALQFFDAHPVRHRSP